MRFAAVYKEFERVDAAVNDTIKKYRKASAEEQKKLTEEFDTLIKSQRELMKQLRPVTKAAYIESPNTNKDVIKTMFGLIAFDLQSDRYNSACYQTAGWACSSAYTAG